MKKLIDKFWHSFRRSGVASVIRNLLPQWVFNTFEHLPAAILANIIYGFPSKKLTVIGVTGTDGKTTTVNMIYQILKSAGKKVSMVSTINGFIAGEQIDTGFHVTSPDPTDIQRFLKKSARNGDEYAVLEVTSHALDQHRFWGVNFKVGVITNITYEHLDYHKTWENYFLAKAKLIQNVEYGILNIDEEKNFPRLSLMSKGKIVSFGLSKQADINPDNFPFKLKIPGQFNILNGLASAAASKSLGIEEGDIKKALENFENLNGRMEEIPNKKGLKIFVDFAHTPNALKEALMALKLESKSGKIIAVFGSAGFRDVGKRSQMGQIAKELADYVVVTAEDPRGLIDKINEQILEGVKTAGGILNKDTFVENDRQLAINLAINKLAQKGDIVGIFGKGHEKSLNLDGQKEIPWSDKEAVRKALNDTRN